MRDRARKHGGKGVIDGGTQASRARVPRYKRFSIGRRINYFYPSGITLNPTPGIAAGPIDEENFFEWEAMVSYVLAVFV